MTLAAATIGLRQFLTPEQQRAWFEGEAELPDAEERSQSLEQRFKYAVRFEKLLRRPQAQDVLAILKLYGDTCIPIPRRTERHYWSVSCLPSTSDRPLTRVNASWMELFTLLPHGQDLRARFILHLSDFTSDASPEPDHLDQALLEQCVAKPGDVSHFLWKADTFGVKVRGAASIRRFLATRHPPRAARDPQVQPHPHEPRPQRLSGEPLLQPRGCHARWLIQRSPPVARTRSQRVSWR
jgi:hypothetical protein